MHGVRSILYWIVQINFGLKPKFGLNLNDNRRLQTIIDVSFTSAVRLFTLDLLATNIFSRFNTIPSDFGLNSQSFPTFDDHLQFAPIHGDAVTYVSTLYPGFHYQS